MAKDPICGMQVDEKKAVKSQHEGQTYYFCCPGCKTTFDKNPAKYSGKPAGGGGHSCCGGH